MKKALCLLLSLLLCVALFSSCADTRPVVMSYDGIPLTADVYTYWLSCYRAQFSASETDENRASFASLATQNIRMTFVASALFDRMGYALSDTARLQVNAAIERMTKNNGGSEATLNEAASVFGITAKGLRDAVSHEQKALALQEALFGDGGVYAPTETELESYYEATYTHARVLTVLTVRYNDFGAAIPLTGTALADKEDKIAAVESALASVSCEDDFIALCETYDEDEARLSYQNGYYFSSEVDYTDYIPAVVTAAASLSAGAWQKVESDTGVHFVYALPLDSGAYANEANADFFDGFTDRVETFLFRTYLRPYAENVTLNETELNKIVYETLTPNFDLYW